MAGKYNCIIIFGNIASGKSTLVNQLKIDIKFKNYKFVCLDDIRESLLCKNNNYNEVLLHHDSLKECEKQLLSNTNIVYETTATSMFYKQIKHILDATYNTFYVFLNCEPYICESRFTKRPYQSRPPFTKNITIKSAIMDLNLKQRRMHKDLVLDSQNNSVEKLLEQLLAVPFFLKN